MFTERAPTFAIRPSDHSGEDRKNLKSQFTLKGIKLHEWVQHSILGWIPAIDGDFHYVTVQDSYAQVVSFIIVLAYQLTVSHRSSSRHECCLTHAEIIILFLLRRLLMHLIAIFYLTVSVQIFLFKQLLLI
jgi:hypothetical protein